MLPRKFKEEVTMSETDELLKNRIRELADKSYRENRYTYTNFLSLAEISVYHEIEREVSFSAPSLFGGHIDCERMVLRFGSVDNLGYDEEFPITCLKIAPLMDKFSDDLSHRDFLGALMNLGIEREVLGDIFVEKNSAYLFCLDSMAEYIIKNLTRVRHTSVLITKVDGPSTLTPSEGVIKNVQIASERIDGVIARVYNMSRTQVNEHFPQKKVFVNGRVTENNSQILKAGDKVTLRGYGKFDYIGPKGTTRKGKLAADVRVY